MRAGVGFFRGVVVGLILGAAFPIADARAQSPDEYIEAVAWFELSARALAESPLQIEADGFENFLPSLEAKIREFKERIEWAEKPLPRAARAGVVALASALRQLNQENDALALVEKWLPRVYDHCDGWSACFSLMSDLSDLVEIAPAAVAKFVDSRFEEQFSGMTERYSRANLGQVGDVYTDSLLQSFLLYRLHSLRVHARYIDASSYTLKEFIAQVPYLEIEAYRDLSSRLQAAEARVQAFSSRLLNSVLREGLIAEWARMLRADLKDFHDPGSDADRRVLESEAMLAAFVEQVIDGTARTHIENQGLILYLDRFNRWDPDGWMRAVIDHVTSDRGRVSAAVWMAVRFASPESYLPHRVEWVDFLRKLTDLSDDPEGLMPLVEAVASLVRLRMGEIEAGLGAQIPDVLRATLLRHERKIHKSNLLFDSLPRAVIRLTRAQSRLVESAWNVSEASGEAEQKKRTFEFHQAWDDMHTAWMTLLCYGASQHRPDSEVFKKPVTHEFSAGEEFDLNTVCMRQGYAGVERSVAQYIYERRIREIWKPFKTEVFFTAASIPMVLASAGFAANVSQLTSAHFARWLATRQVGRITAAVLSRTISAVSGAIAFTAAQQALLQAVTLGSAPAPRLGRDLLYGTAIFLILPHTAMVSLRVGERLARSFSPGAELAAELARKGVRAAGDTLVFTSLAYTERVIERAIERSQSKPHAQPPTEIWRGWGDLFHNLGHSAAIALAFQVHWAGSR